jgi:hypothetical protein
MTLDGISDVGIPQRTLLNGGCLLESWTRVVFLSLGGVVGVNARY